MVPGTGHAYVPYVVPELIIEKEYPAFGRDPLLISALCDACLMSYHPAQMFFKTILQMKADKFVPVTTKEVYDFIYAGIAFKSETGLITAQQLYDQTVDNAIAQLADALKSDIFEPNLRWVKHIFMEARALRTGNPDFITKLVKSPGQLSEMFYEVFAKLGTPFFTNKRRSRRNSSPPRNFDPVGIQPYQLQVFKEIINLFHGKKGCGLYNFCKQTTDKDITNADCHQAPWKRGEEKDLCPFGQFWKTWGLNGAISSKLIVGDRTCIWDCSSSFDRRHSGKPTQRMSPKIALLRMCSYCKVCTVFHARFPVLGLQKGFIVSIVFAARHEKDNDD